MLFNNPLDIAFAARGVLAATARPTDLEVLAAADRYYTLVLVQVVDMPARVETLALAGREP